MKQKITIEFERYIDQNGLPTCACDFPTGEVCKFYRTQRFGCHETCLFASENSYGIYSSLKRRNNNGTLIPGDWCPLFPTDVEK